MTIELEDRSAWSGGMNAFNGNPLKTESNHGGTVVANTYDGMWLRFDDVDLGPESLTEVTVEYDAPSQKAPNDVLLEIRRGDEEGELLGSVALPQTGTGWGTYLTARAALDVPLSGTETLCLVFTGSTISGQMYLGNLDRVIFAAGE
ncbi:carbohydrate-binding protein [Paenibacillus sp. IB182496]|uniref:Carbohydrate-binding protein n=1 Tax=Paenibacillus sabuli TaxID=2772509 RepID=A0A927BYW6_9BACL|nr:carbohydrate-binding protein [Paenibacillus sabuli]MBD2848140.1 carbohydrate-binding protein [Paenibacillus sabuli]